MQTHGDEKECGTVGAAMARRAEDKAGKVDQGHFRAHKGARTSFWDVRRHQGFQAENEVTRFGFGMDAYLDEVMGAGGFGSEMCHLKQILLPYARAQS